LAYTFQVEEVQTAGDGDQAGHRRGSTCGDGMMIDNQHHLTIVSTVAHAAQTARGVPAANAADRE